MGSFSPNLSTVLRPLHTLLLKDIPFKRLLIKLLKLGHNSDMIATSAAMDESIQRIGRPFGGVAIIWNSSIKYKIV